MRQSMMCKGVAAKAESCKLSQKGRAEHTHRSTILGYPFLMKCWPITRSHPQTMPHGGSQCNSLHNDGTHFLHSHQHWQPLPQGPQLTDPASIYECVKAHRYTCTPFSEQSTKAYSQTNQTTVYFFSSEPKITHSKPVSFTPESFCIFTVVMGCCSYVLWLDNFEGAGCHPSASIISKGSQRCTCTRVPSKQKLESDTHSHIYMVFYRKWN